jgi:Holliday junction resolvase RusA-like endonuclease
MSESLFETPPGEDWIPTTPFFKGVIEVQPQSVNKLYQDVIRIRGNWKAALLAVMQGRKKIHHAIRECFYVQRTLTKAGEGFKKKVKLLLLAAGARPVRDKLDGKTPLFVHVWVHSNWWNKSAKVAGTIKKKDVANFEKALLDALSPVLGIEDSWYFEVIFRKKQDEREGFTINVGRMIPGSASAAA